MAFERNISDKRRVVIVDFQHLAYSFAFGGATALSAPIKVDGVDRIVDSTIPAYTIKVLHRWADMGFNPFVVCFDMKGSARSKKYYFATRNGVGEGGQVVGYKEDRQSQGSKFYEGINMTQNLLLNAGVCCLRAENYEADDLIKAAVDKAKELYPDLPIDVITGDQDLVPLVDDQVSVFLRSRRLTWAESKELEKTHYVQITPHNYQEYMESLTDFKKLFVPYNTALLKKLLRGKKADNIPAIPGMTPKKYNSILESLLESGVDIRNLFIYDSPTRAIVYKSTGIEIPADIVDTVPKEQKELRFGDPPALTEMLDVLSDYLTEDELKHVRDTYIGINLNGAFTDLGEYNRRPAIVTMPIKGYDMVSLQSQAAYLQIRIPMY